MIALNQPLLILALSGLTAFIITNAPVFGETEEVTIEDGSSIPGNDKYFSPSKLTIAKGTTVKWENDDSTLHTVTSGKPDEGASGTKFDSSYLAAGKSYSHVFNNEGTFDYYCTLHPFAKGKIIVSDEADEENDDSQIKTVEKEPAVSVNTSVNRNVNVSQWSNFTDTDERFSIEYPSHWSITQSGNRFTEELPLVVNDVTGDSKIQTQLSVDVFKNGKSLNNNELAKLAYNELVKDATGNKLVEPISCDKYVIDGENACSFIYSGNDKEGSRYGILAVVVVDGEDSNHILSYRTDPLFFDKEQATMDHIISSYNLLKNE
ncbi:MAG: plastocyanin/azurin family copper-binding protein [Nitrososphaeraceae archaeon]